MLPGQKQAEMGSDKLQLQQNFSIVNKVKINQIIVNIRLVFCCC